MKQNKKTIILLLMLIVVLSVLGSIFARYRSKGTSTKELEIAYYTIGADSTTQRIKLDSMVPSVQSYDYGIIISNYAENGKVSETAIEYIIQIKTTTNLPLQFYLYDDNKKETPKINLITNTITEADEYGMYYITMTTELREFGLEKEEHNYTLSIVFPEEYKTNAEYADVIELVEVTVDSKQKI